MSRATDTTRAAALATLLLIAPPAPAQPPTGSNQPANAPEPLPFNPASETAERQLEAYLAKLGLHALRAEHIAARLEHLDDRDETQREQLTARLATAYTRLLEQAPTLSEQRVWERRAQTLLDTADGPAATELRLGLARAAFARIESAAEAWILRTASPADRVETLRRLTETERSLADIADTAAARVRRFEQREERANAAAEQERIDRVLAEAERQRSIARYLAGWCAAYAAELDTDPDARADHAARGLAHFGWLLNAPPDAPPTLERLRPSTLAYEHVARAALAVSTLYARTDQTARALSWLDAAENAEQLHPAARRQLFLRRAIALAAADEWRWLEQHLAERRQGLDAATQSPLTTGEARRLAVLAFEALSNPDQTSPNRPPAAAVRDAAIADLVSAGELGHVLDLADRFGFRAVGDASFVADLVRGLTVYGQARDEHRAHAAQTKDASPEDPTADKLVAEQYRRAAAHFDAALNAEQADAFPRALANTAMLRGLALFYAGAADSAEQAGLLDAADLFVRAAGGFTNTAPDRAAEALWLAIRAHDLQLEQHTDADPDAQAIRLSRQQLVQRFLANHPAHQRAAALRLRKAIDSDLPPEEKLELLARVPNASPLAELARRQAARIAYDAFRNADPEDRPFAASRYIALAQPLLVTDRRRAANTNTEAANLAAMRARRIVEAVMASPVPDLQLAERTLRVLEGLIEDNLIEPADIPQEIAYRNAQIALERGDTQQAQQLIDSLTDADTPYADAARRLFYRHARDAFARLADNPDLPTDHPRRLDAAQRLIAVGEPIIEQTNAQPPDQRPAGILSVYADLADAHATLFRASNTPRHRDRALALYNRVLDAQPRSARALAGAADMAEAAGQLTAALEHRRAILAGLERASEPWFQAKLNHARVLAQLDPERARTVLRQHATLYPNWGPDPVGERLRQLARSLGIDPNAPGNPNPQTNTSSSGGAP